MASRGHAKASIDNVKRSSSTTRSTRSKGLNTEQTQLDSPSLATEIISITRKSRRSTISPAKNVDSDHIPRITRAKTSGNTSPVVTPKRSVNATRKAELLPDSKDKESPVTSNDSPVNHRKSSSLRGPLLGKIPEIKLTDVYLNRKDLRKSSAPPVRVVEIQESRSEAEIVRRSPRNRSPATAENKNKVILEDLAVASVEKSVISSTAIQTKTISSSDSKVEESTGIQEELHEPEVSSTPEFYAESEYPNNQSHLNTPSVRSPVVSCDNSQDKNYQPVVVIRKLKEGTDSINSSPLSDQIVSSPYRFISVGCSPTVQKISFDDSSLDSLSSTPSKRRHTRLAQKIVFDDSSSQDILSLSSEKQKSRRGAAVSDTALDQSLSQDSATSSYSEPPQSDKQNTIKKKIIPDESSSLDSLTLTPSKTRTSARLLKRLSEKMEAVSNDNQAENTGKQMNKTSPHKKIGKSESADKSGSVDPLSQLIARISNRIIDPVESEEEDEGEVDQESSDEGDEEGDDSNDSTDEDDDESDESDENDESVEDENNKPDTGATSAVDKGEICDNDDDDDDAEQKLLKRDHEDEKDGLLFKREGDMPNNVGKSTVTRPANNREKADPLKEQAEAGDMANKDDENEKSDNRDTINPEENLEQLSSCESMNDEVILIKENSDQDDQDQKSEQKSEEPCPQEADEETPEDKVRSYLRSKRLHSNASTGSSTTPFSRVQQITSRSNSTEKHSAEADFEVFSTFEKSLSSASEQIHSEQIKKSAFSSAGLEQYLQQSSHNKLNSETFTWSGDQEADVDTVDGMPFISVNSKETLDRYIKTIERKAEHDIPRKYRCSPATERFVNRVKTLKLEMNKVMELAMNADSDSCENKADVTPPSSPQTSTPSKTSDITKIKGWKNKFVSEYSTPAEASTSSAHQDSDLITNTDNTIEEASQNKKETEILKSSQEVVRIMIPHDLKNLGLNLRRHYRQNKQQWQPEDEDPEEEMDEDSSVPLEDFSGNVVTKKAFYSFEDPDNQPSKGYIYGRRFNGKFAKKALVSKSKQKMKKYGIRKDPAWSKSNYYLKNKKTVAKVWRPKMVFRGVTLTRKMIYSALEALQVPESHLQSLLESSEHLPPRCEKPDCALGCVCSGGNTPTLQHHQDDYVMPIEDPCQLPLPPLPAIQGEPPNCGKVHCRLGCVCTSLKNCESKEIINKSHCGRAECIFGCDCKRSLRPTISRVLRSLWQGQEKDPGSRSDSPVNIDTSNLSKKQLSTELAYHLLKPLPVKGKAKASNTSYNSFRIQDGQVADVEIKQEPEESPQIDGNTQTKGKRKPIDMTNVRKSGRKKERPNFAHLDKMSSLLFYDSAFVISQQKKEAKAKKAAALKKKKMSPARTKASEIQRMAAQDPHSKSDEDKQTTGATPGGIDPDLRGELDFDLDSDEETDLTCARSRIYIPVRFTRKTKNDEWYVPSDKIPPKLEPMAEMSPLTKMPVISSVCSLQRSSTDTTVVKAHQNDSVDKEIKIEPEDQPTEQTDKNESNSVSNKQKGSDLDKKRISTQMVLLQKKSKNKDKGIQPLLLEIKSDCDWSVVRAMLLSKISSILSKSTQSPHKTFMVSDFVVERIDIDSTVAVKIPIHMKSPHLNCDEMVPVRFFITKAEVDRNLSTAKDGDENTKSQKDKKKSQSADKELHTALPTITPDSAFHCPEKPNKGNSGVISHGSVSMARSQGSFSNGINTSSGMKLPSDTLSQTSGMSSFNHLKISTTSLVQSGVGCLIPSLKPTGLSTIRDLTGARSRSANGESQGLITPEENQKNNQKAVAKKSTTKGAMSFMKSSILRKRLLDDDAIVVSNVEPEIIHVPEDEVEVPKKKVKRSHKIKQKSQNQNPAEIKQSLTLSLDSPKLVALTDTNKILELPNNLQMRLMNSGTFLSVSQHFFEEEAQTKPQLVQLKNTALRNQEPPVVNKEEKTSACVTLGSDGIWRVIEPAKCASGGPKKAQIPVAEPQASVKTVANKGTDQPSPQNAMECSSDKTIENQSTDYPSPQNDMEHSGDKVSVASHITGASGIESCINAIIMNGNNVAMKSTPTEVQVSTAVADNASRETSVSPPMLEPIQNGNRPVTDTQMLLCPDTDEAQIAESLSMLESLETGDEPPTLEREMDSEPTDLLLDPDQLINASIIDHNSGVDEDSQNPALSMDGVSQSGPNELPEIIPASAEPSDNTSPPPSAVALEDTLPTPLISVSLGNAEQTSTACSVAANVSDTATYVGDGLLTVSLDKPVLLIPKSGAINEKVDGKLVVSSPSSSPTSVPKGLSSMSPLIALPKNITPSRLTKAPMKIATSSGSQLFFLPVGALKLPTGSTGKGTSDAPVLTSNSSTTTTVSDSSAGLKTVVSASTPKGGPMILDKESSLNVLKLLTSLNVTTGAIKSSVPIKTSTVPAFSALNASDNAPVIDLTEGDSSGPGLGKENSSNRLLGSPAREIKRITDMSVSAEEKARKPLQLGVIHNNKFVSLTQNDVTKLGLMGMNIGDLLAAQDSVSLPTLPSQPPPLPSTVQVPDDASNSDANLTQESDVKDAPTKITYVIESKNQMDENQNTDPENLPSMSVTINNSNAPPIAIPKEAPVDSDLATVNNMFASTSSATKMLQAVLNSGNPTDVNVSKTAQCIPALLRSQMSASSEGDRSVPVSECGSQSSLVDLSDDDLDYSSGPEPADVDIMGCEGEDQNAANKLKTQLSKQQRRFSATEAVAAYQPEPTKKKRKQLHSDRTVLVDEGIEFREGVHTVADPNRPTTPELHIYGEDKIEYKCRRERRRRNDMTYKFQLLQNMLYPNSEKMAKLFVLNAAAETIKNLEEQEKWLVFQRTKEKEKLDILLDKLKALKASGKNKYAAITVNEETGKTVAIADPILKKLANTSPVSDLLQTAPAPPVFSKGLGDQASDYAPVLPPSKIQAGLPGSPYVKPKMTASQLLFSGKPKAAFASFKKKDPVKQSTLSLEVNDVKQKQATNKPNFDNSPSRSANPTKDSARSLLQSALNKVSQSPKASLSNWRPLHTKKPATIIEDPSPSESLIKQARSVLYNPLEEPSPPLTPVPKENASASSEGNQTNAADDDKIFMSLDEIEQQDLVLSQCEYCGEKVAFSNTVHSDIRCPSCATVIFQHMPRQPKSPGGVSPGEVSPPLTLKPCVLIPGGDTVESAIVLDGDIPPNVEEMTPQSDTMTSFNSQEILQDGYVDNVGDDEVIVILREDENIPQINNSEEGPVLVLSDSENETEVAMDTQ